MRYEIISLKDFIKGLYLLRRRFKKWRQNEWKNHVVYVYGPFDRVWAEKHPLRFSWIKEYMFIYLQTDYEMHWILRIFYRIFWISIFNTCSYGQLFTGVSPIIWYPSKIYCKRGNIRGTLIFADFAVFQQARIQKPAKIFAIFCMHILDT